jgi:hypothetical protein
VPKKRFTETVDLLDADVFGDFAAVQVGELTDFLRMAEST